MILLLKISTDSTVFPEWKTLYVKSFEAHGIPKFSQERLKKGGVAPFFFFKSMTMYFLDSILIVPSQFKSVFIQLFTVFLLNSPINKDSFTFVF